MNQTRRLAAIAGLILLGLFALGCSSAAGPRGWAPPVAVDNLVLVSTNRGHITAVNTSSRERVWKFPECWDLQDKKARSLQGIYGAPVASSDGQQIYLADYNGFVYAVPAKTYECDRSKDNRPRAGAFKLGDHSIGGVALNSSGDTLFVTSGPSLYALPTRQLIARAGDNKAAVELKEVLKTNGDIWGAPVVSGSNVLVSSTDGRLYLIDPSNGTVSWSYNAGASLASTPTISNGVALVGGFDGELHAVDLTNGQEKWVFKASNWVWSAPVVDSGRAYFGDFDGKVYAVSVSDGTEAWSLGVGKGPIRAAPALAGGTLVVATESGWVVGVDPSGQSKKWETQVHSGIAADVTAKGSSVYIAPKGCVKVGDSSEKTYYVGVDPQSGSLTQASGVC